MLPLPGPLDSCWLLGRLLLSVVMGPECRVLSPDGVPSPVARGLQDAGRSAKVRCAAERGDLVPGRLGASHTFALLDPLGLLPSSFQTGSWTCREGPSR